MAGTTEGCKPDTWITPTARMPHPPFDEGHPHSRRATAAIPAASILRQRTRAPRYAKPSGLAFSPDRGTGASAPGAAPPRTNTHTRRNTHPPTALRRPLARKSTASCLPQPTPPNPISTRNIRHPEPRIRLSGAPSFLAAVCEEGRDVCSLDSRPSPLLRTKRRRKS